MSDFGAIDLAIFNAGIGRRLRVEAFDADDFVSVMTTNVFGVIYGIEAVLPGMLARRSGRIAAVASLAGYRSVPTLAGYGSSKAAVIHALECLRYDLRPHGIGVTIINPGYVRTPLTAPNTFWMPFLIDADQRRRHHHPGPRTRQEGDSLPAALLAAAEDSCACCPTRSTNG